MGLDGLYEDALANLNEAAQLRASTRSPKGKGGSGGSWTQRFRAPGANEDPAQIVLVPGEYEIVLQTGKGKPFKLQRRYGIVYRHYNATKKKYCRCTAGLAMDGKPNNYIIVPGNQPCPSCRTMEDGAAWMQIRKLHVFSIVLLDHFHLVDSDRVNDRTGEAYKEYEECQGKRCKLCKKGVKRVFGKRMYWPLGPMHAGQLGDIARKTLATKCACGGRIRPIAAQCPACGATLRDFDDEPFDTKKELAEFRSSSHTCVNDDCSYKGPFLEIPECDSCRKATPLGLFNTKLEVYMAGKGTQSVLQVSDFEPLSVKLKAKIKDAMIPFNLDKVWDFKPLDPDEQAKVMGIDNPFDNYSDDIEEDESGSSAWGNEDEPDDDGEDEGEDDDIDVDLD